MDIQQEYFIMKTQFNTEKALLVIFSGINSNDFETNKPEISEEEVDDDEFQESGKLPQVDTRIPFKILGSQLWGLAKDVEPSWLNVVLYHFGQFSSNV